MLKVKSKVASDAAQKMNPDLKISVRQDRVCPATESVFDDQF